MIPPYSRLPEFTRRATPAFIALALAACAQLPDLPAAPALRANAERSIGAAQQGAVREWPGDSWWQIYGDAQLDQLIAEALRAAPTLRVAAARLMRADAAVGSAGAASGPQLAATATAYEGKQSYNYLFPRSSLPQGWKDYGQAGFDFSWELDFWGKNRAALAAARGERQAAAAEAAQAQLLLTSSLASAYAELARLFAARDTAVAAVAVRAKTTSLFGERHANGLETLGSLRQAESRHAGAQGELLGIDEQIALQRNRIAALMGADPERGASVARPTIRLDQAPGLPPQLALDLLGRRPDVVASRLRAEAASQRIDAAKAEFYPNVNLSAFVGMQSLKLDKLFSAGSDMGTVGPAISLPLFTSGRLQAQYTGRRAEYDEAVAVYDATVTEALHEVADAATSQRALAGQIERSRTAVDAAQQAWQIARNRYDGGLSNYLDVLTAEDALLAAQRVLSDLQSRAFSLDVALVRALGGGYHAG